MRFMSIILILLLSVAIVLSSCSGNGQQNDVSEKTQTSSASVSTVGDIIEEYKPPIVKYDGEDFRILLRSTSWTPKDVYVENENGDFFNDSVYIRNRAIEEDYNIKITANVPSEATGAALNSYINSLVLSGEYSYDLIMIRISDAASLAQAGVFVNLLSDKAEYLDFTQDCWQYDKIMSTSVAGKLFYATGLATNAADAMSVFFFNKSIANDFNLDNVYDVINNGEFTYDVMYEMSKAVSKDLDGDGVMTTMDQFGMAAQTALARVLIYSGGESVIAKDSEDIPFVKIGDERSIQVISKISQVLSDSNSIYMGPTDDMKAMFFGERALFYSASLSNAEAMRSMDIEFGVIPMPKYDVKQESYYTSLGSHNPCGTAIPVTANSSKASLILQALAHYSMDTVIPAYYDISLNGKYLRDDDSSEMLDIIFDSWTIDLGESYGWGKLVSSIGNAILSGSGITSIIESSSVATNTAIQNTIDIYNNME